MHRNTASNNLAIPLPASQLTTADVRQCRMMPTADAFRDAVAFQNNPYTEHGSLVFYMPDAEDTTTTTTQAPPQQVATVAAPRQGQKAATGAAKPSALVQAMAPPSASTSQSKTGNKTTAVSPTTSAAAAPTSTPTETAEQITSRIRGGLRRDFGHLIAAQRTGKVPAAEGTQHCALLGRVTFVPYPSEEFVLPAGAGEALADMGHVDRTGSNGTVRLFMGQLPYLVTEMQLAWLCWTFGGRNAISSIQRIVKRDHNIDGSIEKVPTGCIHAVCAGTAVEEMAAGMHKRLLIDDSGVWAAITAEEEATLSKYVKEMKRDRRRRIPGRPYDTVVVQRASSAFVPAQPVWINESPCGTQVRPTAPSSQGSVTPRRSTPQPQAAAVDLAQSPSLGSIRSPALSVDADGFDTRAAPTTPHQHDQHHHGYHHPGAYAQHQDVSEAEQPAHGVVFDAQYHAPHLQQYGVPQEHVEWHQSAYSNYTAPSTYPVGPDASSPTYRGTGTQQYLPPTYDETTAAAQDATPYHHGYHQEGQEVSVYPQQQYRHGYGHGAAYGDDHMAMQYHGLREDDVAAQSTSTHASNAVHHAGFDNAGGWSAHGDDASSTLAEDGMGAWRC